MPEASTFNCPKCGAALTPTGAAAEMQCPYCSNTVIVPQELRTTPSFAMPQITLVEDQTAGTVSKAVAATVGVSLALPIVIGVITLCIIGATFFFVNQMMSQSFPSVSQFVNPTSIAAIATSIPNPTAAPSLSFAGKVLTFGSAGTGPGTFNRATNVAVDGAGNIYVGDREGGRVQVFDPAGKFVTQWMVGNSKSILYSLAADRKGIVYAVRDGSIERHEGASGKLLDTLQYSGGDDFESIALAPDGSLAAMWYMEHPGTLDPREGVQGDLVQFDALGKVTRVISSVVSDQTDGPERDVRLAVDGLGNLYALSRESSAVFKFSREGKYINRFGSRGNSSQPDQFTLGVSAIAVDNQGRVFVADSDRVLVFSSEGRYVATFPIDDTAYGMVFDDKNGLWLAESNKVSKFEVNLP